MSTRSPFLTGLLHPLNLLTLALSVVAGLISAWWLFPVGIVVWLAMVIAVARDPSLRISHRMHSRDPLAQRFQKHFDRLERSQVSIFNSLASAAPPVRRALQPVRDEIDRLVDRAYALCQRMTTLENYRLVTQSQSDLEGNLAHLERTIASTDDELTRREYEESREALQRRIAKLEAVSTQLDRVEAQLVGLANALDGVMTELVRLQALSAQDAAERVPALVEQLREEADQLKTFEREAVEV
jgi:chromosome segregation ATPase